jgi:hypothetical protein
MKKVIQALVWATEMLSPSEKGLCRPPLKKGEKGGFYEVFMIYESPLPPLFQRGEP